jgi:L-2,4-diaminobutyrate decarboxylase
MTPIAQVEDAWLAGGPGGSQRLRSLLDLALKGIEDGTVARGGPVPSGSPAEVAALVGDALGGDPVPESGVGSSTALGSLARALARGAADPAHPACAAHLHCPPLAVAVAADVVASILNQSLDSWDQAPAATNLEYEIVRALAGLVGFDPARAAGTITSGGTASNLMGLLLARDAAVRRAFGVDPAVDGLPAEAGRLRVFCSEAAHFSVSRSAALLGLGERSMVPVAVDTHHRMQAADLERKLSRGWGEIPMAVVATAGTTDFGSIDPLPDISTLARAHSAWLHVDAAYGGLALFSDRLAVLLQGIDAADSVALDFHKLGWLPVAAGLFLASRAGAFAPLDRRAAYLNPADDEQAGYQSLLGRSLQTSRRADVFKIAVTLRALGRSGLGALVNRCHQLACHAAARISQHPKLELEADPVLTTVVFRYAATGDPDRVNAALRRRLLRQGRAVIGRTEVVSGSVRSIRLKLTLLNPHTTAGDVDTLLAAVVAAGEEESE